ncbi:MULTISPECIES: glycosyltransferase family 4 protein [unclassified Dyella]|uniref:glycosyltransferase family 4 protein n=1 Tax=unclassified Dyella TaxID=2634549 RepID=UPI000C844753|nr:MULTISPECIES: glycosyltransferase family 4 protein [unclassified Dyella]MDR3445568.1 glycosyltransferase family 4 protein [Dyella sp.]PMQ05205.1 putative teichuronic acid biosynthesis glycosyltransferase TuaC [Dyella sp. AD56]
MRLKVLVLTNLFPSPWDPLRSPFNRQQFERLGREHEVDVLTAVDFRERFGRKPTAFRANNVNTDHFVFFYPPVIGRSMHAAFWLISLLSQKLRRLRRAQYDCMLLSWAYPDAAAASWVARHLGIPYVVKVHGTDLNVKATQPLLRPQIRHALRGAQGVVAVSQALADKVVELGVDPSRVHVIYNGVEPNLFHPGSLSEARAKLSLPQDERIILYVGNLKDTKGCLDLLEAFPRVLLTHPDANLLFIGAGPSREALLQRAAALGCQNRVRLVGAIEHFALGDWFRAADLLCLPSHNEGVPNVVLEAMACGTPVVATRVGGIPEVLPEHAGVLVDAHDRIGLEGALVDALGRSWDGGQIAAHAGRFRWDENIQRLSGILEAAAMSRTGQVKYLAP